MITKIEESVISLADLKELDLPKPMFMKTSSNQFDRLLGGLLNGHITIISATSGNGKSQALCRLAGCCSRKHKILYISMENLPQIDLSIFEKVYGIKYENIDYSNVEFLDRDESMFITLDIINAINNGKYDGVFIDALDMYMQGGSDGTARYEAGKKMMKRLKSLAAEKDIPIVLSWQLNRSAYNKKIEELDGSETADSIGILQYASQFYAVKRDINKDKTKSWQMRLLKTRTEMGEVDTVDFAVYGNDGKAEIIIGNYADTVKLN